MSQDHESVSNSSQNRYPDGSVDPASSNGWSSSQNREWWTMMNEIPNESNSQSRSSQSQSFHRLSQTSQSQTSQSQTSHSQTSESQSQTSQSQTSQSQTSQSQTSQSQTSQSQTSQLQTFQSETSQSQSHYLSSQHSSSQHSSSQYSSSQFSSQSQSSQAQDSSQDSSRSQNRDHSLTPEQDQPSLKSPVAGSSSSQRFDPHENYLNLVSLSQVPDHENAELLAEAKYHSGFLTDAMTCKMVLGRGNRLVLGQSLLLKVKFKWSSAFSHTQSRKVTVEIYEESNREEAVAAFSLDGSFTNESFEAQLYDSPPSQPNENTDQTYFVTSNSARRNMVFVRANRDKRGQLPTSPSEVLDTAHRAALKAYVVVASKSSHPPCVSISEEQVEKRNWKDWGTFVLMKGLDFNPEFDSTFSAGSRGSGSLKLYALGIGQGV
ncbi:hypothetical protein K435DRAFT_803761 [Dendrothele bispora CBS 962.96]|uniref:Uncharacterized protein n=1 Tax=Dendrothele bispora (strain CBS 962.96) TaxID=1314807 RepID=A0A4S8LGD9_DENBC|nr:hypothetical protein K435DRAFT_803761 [Dendrothele bispora CBS 962.96]